METTARNEVLLVGRLAAAPQERSLPSGDVITTFRLVVERTGGRRQTAGRPVTIDSLECVGWTAATRRSAATLAAGDVLEVTGALRRRFWRGSAGPTSRYEVEVERLKRVARAPKAA